VLFDDDEEEEVDASVKKYDGGKKSFNKEVGDEIKYSLNFVASCRRDLGERAERGKI
jgi:hypothetical protein